ncbi:transcription repressor OFP8-like [Zingiber officinale]|uniref:Transcription repressor n=1 Tax=Zingiber officinale TaxID=94328 RepID=A0A8J5FG92_ZINOF|nr:transcription repressor OFP8-like [Zingiber officinale]KAG6481914.1 hypothetical protein ZIOFF_058538 [Zingiber officinale]
MPSSRRKFVLRQTVSVDVGCSCRRPKLLPFLYSAPKSLPQKSPSPFPPSVTASLSETTGTTTTTAVTSSPSPPSYWSEKSARGRKKSVAEGSTAVVKNSSNPYVDFRDSMLQMIVEMEIYAWDDLRDLLHRFLALNAPRHHHLILRAFVELWSDIFSIASPPPPPPPESAFGKPQPRR